jgi:hypothetical protein
MSVGQCRKVIVTCGTMPDSNSDMWTEPDSNGDDVTVPDSNSKCGTVLDSTTEQGMYSIDTMLNYNRRDVSMTNYNFG